MVLIFPRVTHYYLALFRMASVSAVANAVGSNSSGAATSASASDSTADKNVEIWKIKRLIKSLEAARGLVNILIGLGFLKLHLICQTTISTSEW